MELTVHLTSRLCPGRSCGKHGCNGKKAAQRLRRMVLTSSGSVGLASLSSRWTACANWSSTGSLRLMASRSSCLEKGSGRWVAAAPVGANRVSTRRLAINAKWRPPPRQGAKLMSRSARARLACMSVCGKEAKTKSLFLRFRFSRKL